MLRQKAKSYLTIFFAMSCLLAPASIAQEGNPLRPEVQPGQNPLDKVKVFVNFRSIPGQAEQALVNMAGGNIRFSYHLVPAIAAELPLAAVEALEKNPAVVSIELDGEVQLLDAELDNSWGVKHIRAGEVHAMNQFGLGVKVAVLDTGIDYNHTELKDNYVTGYDFYYGDNNPMDLHSHGTHAAGIVGAADNNSGVVGVAPKAQLYALKVLGDDGYGNWSSIVAGVQWCVDNRIQVLNCSFGTLDQPSTTVKSAFDNAYARGIVNVAAAGNLGYPDGSGDRVAYPAKYDSVIAVASVYQWNTRASSSSTGPAVELSAPGINIYSTITKNNYGYKSGTSMASPHVAEAAALVIGAGVSDQNGDGKINDEVRKALTSTAVDLGDPGRDPWYGYGLVNVSAAVKYFGGGSNPAPTNTPTNTPITVSPTNTPKNNPTNTPVSAPTSTPTVTPTPATVGNMSVSSIDYSTSGGKAQDKHLSIGIIIVDKNGFMVTNASVQVDIEHNGVLNQSVSLSTGNNGIASLTISNANSGTYRTIVQNVQASSYQWDQVCPYSLYTKK